MGTAQKQNQETIKIDYENLISVSNRIGILEGRNLAIISAIEKSIGNAADSEKEIAEILSTICSDTVRKMLVESKNLLVKIANTFKDTDEKMAETPQKGK